MNDRNDDAWGADPRLYIRTCDELQAARKAAAERFEAIAMKYVPADWRVEYRKSLTGRCYTSRKTIAAPRPRTRKALYIFLHECAHIHLHAIPNRWPKAHVRELEAERWAHEKMREHDVPVPKEMTKRAKQYVRRKIQQAIFSGAKTIDAGARRFAKR